MPLSDDPTTRLVHEQHLADLPPAARRIAEVIARLSRATWGTAWHHDVEHHVWRAAHHHGSDRELFRLGLDECALLRHLADSAGGWVAWNGRPTLVPMATWVALHGAWCARAAEHAP